MKSSRRTRSRSLVGLLETFLRRVLARGKPRLLQPGDLAPDFVVQDHLGRRVQLAEFRGKRVCLWFYPKADTPG